MITVLTPTYNRAYILSRAFESLCKQTDMRFEWVVVDDGSKDNTTEVLKEFAAKAPFEIRAFYQENAGKHAASNKGAEVAKGEWLIVLDSDDALTPDAIQTIYEKIGKYSQDDYTGICFRRADFDGHIIGQKLDHANDTLIMGPAEAGKTFQGDLVYVFKTKTLLAVPFPIIKAEKFVPEAYIWNKIGKLGKIVFFHKKYVLFCEYLADGYSANFKKNLRSNPRGFLLYYWSEFFTEKNFKIKIKYLIRSVQCMIYMCLNKMK